MASSASPELEIAFWLDADLSEAATHHVTWGDNMFFGMLMLEVEGAVFVTKIEPEGVAESQGVEVGWRLYALNSKAIPEVREAAPPPALSGNVNGTPEVHTRPHRTAPHQPLHSGNIGRQARPDISLAPTPASYWIPDSSRPPIQRAGRRDTPTGVASERDGRRGQPREGAAQEFVARDRATRLTRRRRASELSLAATHGHATWYSLTRALTFSHPKL